jgi:hypothetical protein
MRFQGDLAQNDQIVLQDVVGEIQEHAGSTGQHSCSGRLEIPLTGSARLNGPYKLILDDGPTYEIIVTRVSGGVHRPPVAEFRGSRVSSDR